MLSLKVLAPTLVLLLCGVSNGAPVPTGEAFETVANGLGKGLANILAVWLFTTRITPYIQEMPAYTSGQF